MRSTGVVDFTNTAGTAFSGARSGPVWQPTQMRCSPFRSQNHPCCRFRVLPEASSNSICNGWSAGTFRKNDPSGSTFELPSSSVFAGLRLGVESHRLDRSVGKLILGRVSVQAEQVRVVPVVQSRGVKLGNWRALRSKRAAQRWRSRLRRRARKRPYLHSKAATKIVTCRRDATKPGIHLREFAPRRPRIHRRARSTSSW